MTSIYLDHAATTPVHADVLEAMLPYYRNHFGNASSLHSFGRSARFALDDARERIARQLGCKANEIVFTSGGTESDNMAIYGLVRANPDKKHVITSSVEHHAVLHACRQLEQAGYEVTYLSVDQHGQVSVEELEAAITSSTALITIMFANNETGTLQPIEEIGRIARQHHIPFHTDAIQAIGLLPAKLNDLPIDAMSISAHKIGGPKGIGALYVSNHLKMHPLLFGGSQEYGRRAGTENVPAIVGFSKAVELTMQEKERFHDHCRTLENTMRSVFSTQLPSDAWKINGHERLKLPHILNVSFIGVDSQSMLMNLDMEGIAVSAGSACSSGSLQPSHVLQAMGLPHNRLNSAIRFSFGLQTNQEDVRIAAEKCATIYERMTSK